MLADRVPEIETIDVTITGRSSKQLIVRHMTSKRRMTCSTDELLDELSIKFPAKRRLTVDNNIITGYEK